MNTGLETPAHKVARRAASVLRKLALRPVRYTAARVLAEQLRNDAYVLTSSADALQDVLDYADRAIAQEVASNLRDRAKRLCDLADALEGK